MWLLHFKEPSTVFQMTVQSCSFNSIQILHESVLAIFALMTESTLFALWVKSGFFQLRFIFALCFFIICPSTKNIAPPNSCCISTSHQQFWKSIKEMHPSNAFFTFWIVCQFILELHLLFLCFIICHSSLKLFTKTFKYYKRACLCSCQFCLEDWINLVRSSGQNSLFRTNVSFCSTSFISVDTRNCILCPPIRNIGLPSGCCISKSHPQ